MMIPNGCYTASLVRAEIAPMEPTRIWFTWQLEQMGTQLYSSFYPLQKDGTRNARGVASIRSWAANWDGHSLSWFAEQLAAGEVFRVKLFVKAMPHPNDPTRTIPTIVFIAPLNEATQKPIETPVFEGFERIPANLEPTMQNAWNIYAMLTEHATSFVRDRWWINRVHQLVPKNQVDFTADDWRRVIADIINPNKETNNER